VESKNKTDRADTALGPNIGRVSKREGGIGIGFWGGKQRPIDRKCSLAVGSNLLKENTDAPKIQDFYVQLSGGG